MRLPCRLALLVCIVGLLAGCQTGEVKAVLPLADGNQITIPVTTAPPRGEGEGYHVARAVIMPPNKDQQLCYDFALDADKTPALRRIQIDDVSDETIEPLLDDSNPKFVGQKWEAKTEMLTADDARLKWLFQITGSMRVYRFTLTATDGHKISFYQVTPYPPFIKNALRTGLGASANY